MNASKRKPLDYARGSDLLSEFSARVVTNVLVRPSSSDPALVGRLLPKGPAERMPLKNSGRSVRVAARFFLPGLVLLAYGWSLFNSPAFGSLADQPYHLALAQEYEQALRAGEFPPRWSAGLNGGRGAPTFVVYPTGVQISSANTLLDGLSP